MVPGQSTSNPVVWEKIIRLDNKYKIQFSILNFQIYFVCDIRIKRQNIWKLNIFWKLETENWKLKKYGQHFI